MLARARKLQSHSSAAIAGFSLAARVGMSSIRRFIGFGRSETDLTAKMCSLELRTWEYGWPRSSPHAEREDLNMALNKTPAFSKFYYQVCCYILFFVAASASFNGYFEKFHFIDYDQYGAKQGVSTFESIIDGTAWRPFVYRQLLPTLADWIDQMVPEHTKDSLYAAKDNGGRLIRTRLIDSTVMNDRDYFFRYLIVYCMVFLFAWIAVQASYKLCKAVGMSAVVAAFSAISFILLIPYMENVGGYFWDYPELAFFMLAAWMAVKFDWWWLIPLTAIATWNKESFLLFIPTLYPLLRLRTSRKSALAGTAVLGLTSAAVYESLRLRYHGNPGGTVFLQLNEQVHSLPNLLMIWHNSEKAYGITLPRTENIVWLAFMGCTVYLGWRYLPRAFQRHAQIAAIINIPLYILFCHPGEMRDLSMLYITLFLLVAVHLNRWIGVQGKAGIEVHA
jgi:hypothetical protein